LYNLNILKKRREGLNLNRQFQIKPTNDLLLKGYYFGGIIFSIFIVIFLLIFLYNQNLLSKKNKLKVFSDEFDLIQNQLIKNNNSINKIKQTNSTLIKAISGIRSGSGLFAELASLTPKTMELDKLEIGKSGVKISGISPQKNGLKILNSFEIALSKSPFFNKETIKIVEAKKFSRNDFSKIKKDLVKNNYLKFEIIANFNESTDSVNSDYLNDLGSYGLSKRLEIINKIK